LESLGEEMRRRVRDKFGLTLQWEIQRIGQFKDDFDTCGEA
jgi:UDP-N-acetylmuramate dehydrogenase